MKQEITIPLPEFEASLSGILNQPDGAACILLLAHGAGAGMQHPFMEQLSQELADKGIATLRFNFLYMELGKKVPDRAKKALAAINAALTMLRTLTDLPIYLSGKSFGGRMSSHLASQEKLEGVKGLVFFGFPLHAPGKPGIARAEHLADIGLPMLFLQGTRDTLAQIPRIKEVCEGLSTADLRIIEGADHSFKMLKKSGRTQDEVLVELAGMVQEFVK